MAKPFFEVFPTLKIENPLHDRLEETSVERVAASRRRDMLRVYLLSTHLIGKEEIWETEKAIKKQLFPQADLTVRIRERFELSSQYTPQNLVEAYWESILAELMECSHIEYNAFKTAEISYPEPDRMVITVEDTMLNRSKEEELLYVLDRIFVSGAG